MALQEPSSSKRKREKSESETTENKVQRSKFVLDVTEKLYLDKNTADFYFICGPDRVVVPAHKCILAKGSDVFYAMIYGGKLEENENSNDKTINENDIELKNDKIKIELTESPEALKDFLQFFYKDKVKLNVEHITEVMGLSHKYLMNECLDMCGKFWSENLTIEDFCWAYHWAIHYNFDKLKIFCERKISMCTKSVFETESFLTSEFVVLKHILELESISCNEISVLKACLEWAHNACRKRKLDGSKTENLLTCLEDSLYKIRFGSIDHFDFIAIIDKYPGLIANLEDYESVHRLLSGNFSKPGKFNPSPRSQKIFKWNDQQILYGSIPLNDNPKKDLTSHLIILSSNRPVLFGGFYCARISSNQQLLFNLSSQSFQTQKFQTLVKQSRRIEIQSIEVIISEESTKESRNIHSQSHLLSSNSETFFDIRSTPIIIHPNYKYSIELKTYSNNLYHFAYNISSNMKLNEKITIRTDKEEGKPAYTFISSFVFNPL
ncbi:uncharacterized protein LOC116348492 [Contarinia nasturtii]|uniref:uncharacterized protein LOC116348492 n=1 Tax=Contarinia nasturtii TaxID=265458 RepID=UPI0012D4145D|nr:uncharacterized protein LOC116348492 [Contarinia nasturtii]